MTQCDIEHAHVIFYEGMPPKTKRLYRRMATQDQILIMCLWATTHCTPEQMLRLDEFIGKSPSEIVEILSKETVTQ